MLESDLQRACEDYLQYQQNLGKLWFTRLNSGSAFLKKGDKFYKIALCEKGTSDFIVIKGQMFQFSHRTRPNEKVETTAWFPYCKVIFLELKSAKGKQSSEQRAFKILVEAQGASYFVIRSMEELEVVLQ